MASERLKRQIDRLLNEVEEAISHLDWATVRARAQAVLANDPDNVDALAFLTGAERALGREDPVQHVKISQPPPSAHTQPTAEPTSFANGRYQVTRSPHWTRPRRVEMGNTGKVDALSTLLRAIDERDNGRNRRPVARTVLERRHGLRSGSVETLETIGNDLSLTRERIRQIESRAMRALRGEDSLGPEVDAIRGGLRSKFDEILLSLGGAGTGAELDEHMGPYLDLTAFARSELRLQRA